MLNLKEYYVLVIQAGLPEDVYQNAPGVVVKNKLYRHLSKKPSKTSKLDESSAVEYVSGSFETDQDGSQSSKSVLNKVWNLDEEALENLAEDSGQEEPILIKF